MATKILEIDSEDLETILIKIEQSFDIKFGINELKNAQTFGDFTSIILSKINGENTTDCTSQQAFYKLRKAVLDVTKIDINPETHLSDIFPEATRKRDIAAIEAQLDIKLDILTPKALIVRLLTLLTIVSVFGLFLRPTLGFVGIVSSIVLFELAYRFGIELQLNSVKELVNKMVKTNYKKSRRHPLTVNFDEIEPQILAIFEDELGLKKGELTADKVLSFH
jgi:hypothetical protein